MGDLTMKTQLTTVVVIQPTAAGEWLVCWTVKNIGTKVLWRAASQQEAYDFIASVARYGL
jgi:hypothetical protein